MNLFLQQFVLLLALVILQRSFFDILWPGFDVPALIIAATIALVFILGFARALGWVLMLIFLYVLLGSNSEIGYFPVIAVVVAYGTSFLSRRLLIERPIQSSLTLAFVSGLSVGAAALIFRLFQDSSMSLAAGAGDALLTMLIFPIVFIVLRIREEHVRSSLMSEFRGLRT